MYLYLTSDSSVHDNHHLVSPLLTHLLFLGERVFNVISSVAVVTCPEEEDGVESSDGVVGGRLTMDGEDAG